MAELSVLAVLASIVGILKFVKTYIIVTSTLEYDNGKRKPIP